jgi:CheY-like chemotaxis protein
MVGGELVVESELGKGSTFRVSIPGVEFSEEKIAAVPEQKAMVDLKKFPKRVLVVDDSPVNRSVLTALLKRAGVTSINQAVDGEEAFSELASALNSGNPYDFVFSDFWMPNMNGLELIEKLRADSRFKSLSVFALTADTEVNQDARANLYTGVLLKPVTYNKLVTVFTSAS